MAPPRKKSTPKGDGQKPKRSGKQIAVYVDEDIYDSLGQYIEDYNSKNPHPATLRSTTEAAFKMFLKAAGFYPPKKG